MKLLTTGMKRSVSLVLVTALVMTLFAPLALAAPVPSQTTCAAAKAGDAQAVAAERDLVKATLMDFGLSEQAASSRVDLLTDAEVHAIAADLNSVQTAGALGDNQNDIVVILLLLILVAILAD